MFRTSYLHMKKYYAKILPVLRFTRVVFQLGYGLPSNRLLLVVAFFILPPKYEEIYKKQRFFGENTPFDVLPFLEHP